MKLQIEFRNPRTKATYYNVTDWPHVPRVGDGIQVAEGWPAFVVQRVTWLRGGTLAAILIEGDADDRLLRLGDWRGDL